MQETRLTTERQPCTPAPDGSCAVCADDAVPARVVAVDPATRTAAAEVAGTLHTVALDLVDDVHVGDTVMVHLGFAIARVEAP